MKTKTIKRGRPTKRTPKLTKSIYDYISDGLPLKDAAALSGISYETFCDWRRKYPEFSDAIDKAIARGVASRLSIIGEAAKKGDVGAAKWWLEHVRAEDFAKNRVEVAHKHEGSISHKHSVDNATLEKIAEARNQYESGADRTG